MVTDEVASHSGSNAIGFFQSCVYGADKANIGEVFPFIGRNFKFVDDFYCASSLHMTANTLCESAKFVSGGDTAGIFEFCRLGPYLKIGIQKQWTSLMKRQH